MDTVHTLIDEIMGRVSEAEWDTKDYFAVNLSLEEGLVNAVKHGNGEDPSKTVRFLCRLSNSKIYVRIEDEGNGFSPNDLPDPTDPENIFTASGRGCYLIKNFSTRVQWNEKGNVLEFEKERNNV
jgi:serine/threonine-protein kinase RsbW